MSEDEFTSKDQLYLYESLEAYNYLQLCFHQLKRHEEALEAAFTYYIFHESDEVAKSNLEYYLRFSNIPLEKVKNLEAFNHTEQFYTAKENYEGQNWPLAISGFEQSLASFWQELDNCRLLCEKPFDHGWFPDFVSSVANHFTFVLKCKSKCEEKLTNLDGNPVPDFVSLVYNYLQFSYYQDKNYEKAARCVASFQLFNESSQEMINNKNFYLKELKLPSNYFRPRDEAIAFDLQIRNEKTLLQFIEKKFVIDLMKAKKEHYLPGKHDEL